MSKAFIIMNRFISIIILTAFSCLIPYTGISSVINSSSVDIPIEGNQGSGEGDDPNSVTVIPIICQLSDFADELEFGFLADLGNVTITLINFSAGTMQTGMLNSQLGIVYFPITLGSGQYYMTLVTPTGKTYHAQFAI